MADVSARDIQALRQATGAGMLDCKRALETCGGDADAARQWLREKGLSRAGGEAARETNQGAVAVHAVPGDESPAAEGHGPATSGPAPGPAAIVELRCETDFVAKSPEFVRLVQELAERVATAGEQAISERQAEVDALRLSLKEAISVGRVVRFAPAPEAALGTYLHVQSDRGVNGVMVEVAGGSPELAHEIAVHIAFARPDYLSADEVPAEQVAAERATLETLSRNEGKPEASLDKIVEGRMRGWFAQHCLVDQPYVREEKLTVAQHLGAARVTRFAQVVVGS